jgi:hypothetical protein
MKRMKTDVRYWETSAVIPDLMDKIINRTTWVSFHKARLDLRC